MTALTYSPAVFDVKTMAEAMSIILTPEDDDTETRWERETEWLAGEIISRLAVTGDSVLLDYGCGIGRLSRALIERTGCRVIGADISPSMRMLSQVYVNADRFTVMEPGQLAEMVRRGLRLDGAFSVWVLQHCADVRADLSLIRAAMGDGARLVVVNDRRRIVPTLEAGWANDGLDIQELLAGEFTQESVQPIETDAVARNVALASFLGVYRK